MEILPVMIGLVVLIATHRRFELTLLSYQLLWLFGLVLIVGGYYTYAGNPPFNWLRDAFDLRATTTTGSGISCKVLCWPSWRGNLAALLAAAAW